MKTDNLLIQPRMPRLVKAETLLASPAAFDEWFHAADVVDFTEFAPREQPNLVDRYMKLHDCQGEYKKPEEERWRQRQKIQRTRRDYYLAALADHDPSLTHKIFYTGKWDLRFQTNLLIITNPQIIPKFQSLGKIQLTPEHAISFDFVPHNKDYHYGDSLFANILILPEKILSELAPNARQKIVHSLGRAMYLSVHDDLHGSVNTSEKTLRIATAALFKTMPEEFRQEVVQQMVDGLSVLDDPKSCLPSGNVKTQKDFWHGAFTYVAQYLFNFNDPLLEPFTAKLKAQNPESDKNYPIKIRNAIWQQLRADGPENIHNPDKQEEALSHLKRKAQKMVKTSTPVAHPGTFLPRRTKSGETIFMPPPVLTPTLLAQGVKKLQSAWQAVIS